MKLFNRKATEADRAHETLLVIVAGFRNQLQANTEAIAWLRDELRAVRAEVNELPSSFDVTIARNAMELVAGAHEQIGVQRQQIALLSDSEALIELAGSAAVKDFGELLAEESKRHA